MTKETSERPPFVRAATAADPLISGAIFRTKVDGTRP
jgi:hypothetical protein